tara:strand:+ start:51 stop:260 length:210 start_codon:yes stop_codon:yes gene_type:complete
MLVYFFSITYGMYLATMLEYISYNSAFYNYYPKEDYYQFYRGRPVWEIFDYYILYEFAFAEFIGKPIKP